MINTLAMSIRIDLNVKCATVPVRVNSVGGLVSSIKKVRSSALAMLQTLMLYLRLRTHIYRSNSARCAGAHYYGRVIMLYRMLIYCQI